MYRHQQYESRMKECTEQAPFFREAVNLIDECTKLPKDDRITLRNQIKEYLRSLRDNRSLQNEEDTDHLQQLVQIFIEANRKKSLGKIHKGDRLMDWLQIKLRKLIDQSKKEKHRKEIENFKKHKFIEVKKKPQKSILHRPQDRDPFHILGISHKTNEHSRMINDQNERSRKTNQQKYLIPSSLSRSRERSPVQTSRKSSHSYAQYSYHKNFPFLRKAKEENHPERDISSQQQSRIRQLQLQKRIAGLNRSVDQLSKCNGSNKVSTSRSKYELSSKREINKNTVGSKTTRGNQSKREKQTKKTQEPWKREVAKPSQETTKQEISKLTKLFTQQLNSAPQIPIVQHQEQTFMSPTFNFTPIPQPPITNYNSYEQSSKKLQEMLQGSKSILQQLSSGTEVYFPQNYHQQFNFSNEKEKKQDCLSREEKVFEEVDVKKQVQNNVEDIFTPPDFLAECRKLITSSQKKVEENWKDYSGSKEDSGTKLTFNNVLSDSREHKQFAPQQSFTSKFGQITFNEVVSENPSVNISSKKTQSEVQFQLKNTSIFTASQLLLEIFKTGPTVSLDRYQLGHIMSLCDQTTEGLLQDYCSILEKDQSGLSLEFKFVAMVKFCFSYGKTIEESQFSSFLCSILDMKKNGYVSEEDLNDFLESMEGSGVEQEMLDQITSLLHSVFGRCSGLEGAGSMMTRWSLSYLELTKDESLNRLNELLSRFEFQIDSQE